MNLSKEEALKKLDELRKENVKLRNDLKTMLINFISDNNIRIIKDCNIDIKGSDEKILSIWKHYDDIEVETVTRKIVKFDDIYDIDKEAFKNVIDMVLGK